MNAGGALLEWQKIAPDATTICSLVSKLVSVDDVVTERPAKVLGGGEELVTGKFHFRFLQILYVPHAWDGGHLFEKSSGTLLRSDLFHQHGDVEAMTNSEVVSRFKKSSH